VARKLTDAEARPIMLAAGLTPLGEYPGSASTPWRCRHECGREAGPRYTNIQQGKGGCAVCAGHKVDLEIVMATMATAGLTPLASFPGSNKPWLCLHKCGREVRPQYSSIKQGGSGCMVCAGNKVDLEIVMATMATAGLTPLEEYPGSACTPWRCRHECGREVTPRYNSIQQGQSGCAVCAGRAVDLAIVMATMASAGLTPLEPYRGNHVPWLCRHKCGREVMPVYTSIQQGLGGCRFCDRPGYNSSRPGRVYLIELNGHPDFPRGVLKIGITGHRTRRLNKWQNRGWAVLEDLHLDDGSIPPKIEREVLKWFNKDLGLEPCLTDADMGGLGASTETVSVADLTAVGVSVADVRKKVAQLVKKQNRQLVKSAGGAS
jgi:hypothetical protein